MPRLVWLIDDSPANHRAAAATVAGLPAFVLAGFLDGDEAVAAFAACAARTPERLPEVVLMDFYLGDTRGDRVTEALRAVLTPRRVTIVGYSSVASGSQAIVAAGGDAIVRKRIAADGTNPDLRAYLAARAAAD